MTTAPVDALQAQVQGWLEKQGYPLEMRVAKSFQDAGYLVFQGWTYVDPESKVTRELDVLGSKGIQLEFGENRLLAFGVRYHVECKTTPGKPWIAFESAPSLFNSPLWELQMPLPVVMFGAAIHEASGGALELPFPRLDEIPLAFGLAVALRNSGEHDLAYNALKAATAANARDEADGEVLRRRFEQGAIYLKGSIPLIVIDQPLFVASLDAQSVVHLRRVPAVFVRAPASSRTERVLVATEQFLPELLSTTNGQMTAFTKAFSEFEKETVERIWKFMGEHLQDADDE